MNILAITNLYPTPHQPNRATFNRQQFRAIAAEHPLRIITPIAWTDERAGRRAGHAPLPTGRHGECDGIEVDHPRYWFTPKILRNGYGRFFHFSIRRTFEQTVGQFKPDVILASWAYPDGWAAVRLGHAAGLPVVIKVHGSDVLLGNRQRQRQVAEALLAADGIIAVSRDLPRRVIDMGVEPGKVRLIYNGVDATRFYPGNRPAARQRLRWPADMPQVLFVGNLVPVKGLDVLIEALARLKREQIPFHCHLIGQGPLRQALQRQADAAGVADRLTFVGPVPHAQLPDWFRAADLFVLPSRSEGVPNVLLEAAGCGTPFVASNVGGIPEIAHLGRSHLVPAEDATALEKGIGHMLERRALHSSPAAPTRSHEQAAAEIIDCLGAASLRCLNSLPPLCSIAQVAR